MGDQASLDPFVAEDSFLRRIDKKRYIAEGIIPWNVFDPRKNELTLSFTLRDERLETDEGLAKYRSDKALPSGDLPGICMLTFDDLTRGIKPPLPPRADHDHSDEIYGHLHCITDRPRDFDHAEKMAKLATQNGVLLPFVKAKKR